MTKDEALRLALEALKKSDGFLYNWHENSSDDEADAYATARQLNEKAITAAKAALLSRSDGEAKDEPVAQPKVRTNNCLRVGVCASEGHKIQPQRTWVGLTAEEREQVQAESYGKVPHHVALIAAVEAKLKEKNT